MSSELYAYQISKVDLEKDKYLSKQFKDNVLDSVDACLGEAEGFSLVWISPRVGHLWEGLTVHAPELLKPSSCRALTKEQVTGILEVSRKEALADKPEFHDPEEHYEYLMKEFKEFEDLVEEFDFENNYLFAYTN